MSSHGAACENPFEYPWAYPLASMAWRTKSCRLVWTEVAMTRLARTALGLIALLMLASVPARAQEQVDLLLVLASDVSRSVDTRKFELQRQGYAEALTNPRVIEAIRSGPHGKIAICFVEWSGQSSQKVVIDWTIVGDAPSARRISD